MVLQDKSLQCSDCAATFTFTADEQKFFQSKGYVNEPKRCPQCRQTRKGRLEGSSNRFGAVRQMFPATCAECGKATEVPFEPRTDRPVYCRDCYSKVRPAR